MTIQDPSVDPEPGASRLIIISCNYQFTRIAGAGMIRNSGVHESMYNKSTGHCI